MKFYPHQNSSNYSQYVYNCFSSKALEKLCQCHVKHISMYLLVVSGTKTELKVSASRVIYRDKVGWLKQRWWSNSWGGHYNIPLSLTSARFRPLVPSGTRVRKVAWWWLWNIIARQIQYSYLSNSSSPSNKHSLVNIFRN